MCFEKKYNRNQFGKNNDRILNSSFHKNKMYYIFYAASFF